MWQLNGASENPAVKEEVAMANELSETRESADAAKAKKGAKARTDEKVIWHAPKETLQKQPLSVLKTQLVLCMAVLLAVVGLKIFLKDSFSAYAEQLDIWLSQGMDFAQRDEAARFVNSVVNGICQSAKSFLQMMQS